MGDILCVGVAVAVAFRLLRVRALQSLKTMKFISFQLSEMLKSILILLLGISQQLRFVGSIIRIYPNTCTYVCVYEVVD